MAEYVDDTRTFTIALKAPATTITPVSVTLEWVQETYDTNGSRYIETTELQQAAVDAQYGRITKEQYNAVAAAKVMHTLLPAPATIPGMVTAAKGELVSVSAPSSGVMGGTVSVSCRVKNTGRSTGTFTVELRSSATTKVGRLTNFTVGAGSTSATKIHSIVLPTSGASASYTLRCIRFM